MSYNEKLIRAIKHPTPKERAVNAFLAKPGDTKFQIYVTRLLNNQISFKLFNAVITLSWRLKKLKTGIEINPPNSFISIKLLKTQVKSKQQ